jgi:hypothetical protein
MLYELECSYFVVCKPALHFINKKTKETKSYAFQVSSYAFRVCMLSEKEVKGLVCVLDRRVK